MADENKKDDLGQSEGPRAEEPSAVPLGEHRGEPPEDVAAERDAAAGEVPRAVGPFAHPREEPVTGAAARADPGEEEPARDLPPPTRRSRGGALGGFIAGLLGALLVLAFVLGAAYATRDRWMPPVTAVLAQHLPTPPGQSEERLRLAESVNTLKGETTDVRSQLAATTNRLSSLQQELDTLKQQVDRVAATRTEASQTPPPDISQPLDDINQRLGQLEVDAGRLTAVEQRLGDVQAALAEVRSTVDQAGKEASRPAATVLAVNQLAEALGRSDGYAQELETLRVVAGDEASLAAPIDRLQQWASSGLATIGELRAAFPEMARAVAQTDYQREGDSWLDGVTNRLTSLVTVRRVGDVALAAGGTDAALAQAESALDNGDLAGAVKAIEGLQGPAAEAASGWLTRARDRLGAEKALADLRMAAVAQLNAARG
jgi:hypothetical protein